MRAEGLSCAQVGTNPSKSRPALCCSIVVETIPRHQAFSKDNARYQQLRKVGAMRCKLKEWSSLCLLCDCQAGLGGPRRTWGKCTADVSACCRRCRCRTAY